MVYTSSFKFQVSSFKKNGFTFLEVIAAIFVLTVGVLAAYSVTSQLISATHLAANRLIAAYLAKEGIEIVRNIRDTNWVDNSPATDWNNGLSNEDYKADYDDTGLDTNWDIFLKFDGNFYSYDGSNNTPFKRKIIITSPNTDDCPLANCLAVTVEVRWEEKGETKGPITVKENLYNWYPI